MSSIVANDRVSIIRLQKTETVVLSRPEVDLESVRERVGNDERLVRMLIGFFVAEAPVLAKRLHKAARAQSSEELHTLAHQLKGLSADVSANAVRRCAQRLEDDARNQHIEDAELAVADLQVHVERALTFLQQ